MEAQYKTRNGRLLIKVLAPNQKLLFKELANTQEVFEAETECGCCNSDDIRYRVRDVDGNDRFELVCTKCGARFEFGQHKKNDTLFPKRKGQDNGKLPNRGWEIWNGDNGAGNTSSSHGN